MSRLSTRILEEKVIGPCSDALVSAVVAAEL
jgi:hypothetical protein